VPVCDLSGLFSPTLNHQDLFVGSSCSAYQARFFGSARRLSAVATSTERNQENRRRYLGVADVAVDSHSSPSCLRLRIKASKTDPFRKGCFLHIGKGEFPLCAISSLLPYLTLSGDAAGPLFLLRDGWPLSHALLTSWLRGILSAVVIQGNFSSHSFRIGAATVTAQRLAFRTIKFKPWDVGQAQPICCTFVLLQSRCLECLSSFLSRPLIDGLFQVH